MDNVAYLARFVLASVVGADRPERREGVARTEATVAHLLHMPSRRLAGYSLTRARTAS